RSREVAGGTVAEPAAAQADVQVLRHRELAARAAHVVAVAPRIGGDGERIADAPAVRAEHLRVPGHAAHVHGHLEGGARAGRELEAAQPLRALPPGEGLAAEDEVAPARIPLSDRGVGGARRAR